MAKKVLVVLADGFEDIEAVAPIDIMTRVGVQVTVASLKAGPVKAAYGLTLMPDMTIDEVAGTLDGIVFPGGTANAKSLAANARVIDLVRQYAKQNLLVAAICAAPSHILAEAAGILNGRRATGDPNFNDKLAAGGAHVTGESVTVDENIITGMGPGAAMLFGLQLAEYFVGRETPDRFAEKWRVDRSAASTVS